MIVMARVSTIPMEMECAMNWNRNRSRHRHQDHKALKRSKVQDPMRVLLVVVVLPLLSLLLLVEQLLLEEVAITFTRHSNNQKLSIAWDRTSIWTTQSNFRRKLLIHNRQVVQ